MRSTGPGRLHHGFSPRPDVRATNRSLTMAFMVAPSRVCACIMLRWTLLGNSRIKFQMELFNLHIQQGRDLCSKLSSVASVIKTPPAQLQSQLAIEVVSPILANSQNPLSVAREPL